MSDPSFFYALDLSDAADQVPAAAPRPSVRPALPARQQVIGWVSSVSSADGVIFGWAADTRDPRAALVVSFFSDSTPTQGGKLMGTALANAVDFSVGYMHGLSGSHGFNFSIPDQFKDGQHHKFFTEASYADGSASQSLLGSISTFTLKPMAMTSTVSDPAACLSPQSTCASQAFDYGRPNFASATGWSDGNNYFKAWACTSSAGLNHIARLQILPSRNGTGKKYHNDDFQKDSLLVNSVDQMFGSPIIYFTASRYNRYSSVFSLKKAAYGRGHWQIFDMLDYPSSAGGLSSLDGRYPAFIMNDYSQPGWGPTSPFPGSSNYVPGVSEASINPERNSFPLIGSGPNGLTTIADALQGASASDGGVSGRTCIHMNPKLFDFNSKGVPQSMIAYLYQGATNTIASPCALPDGSKLPSVGYYVYRYQGATGWQLDRAFGPVESDPKPDQALKLEVGADKHSFLGGNWDGEITVVDLDAPPPRKRRVVLSCGATANGRPARFGEATGNIRQVWFLAIPPGAPPTYGNGVFTGDVYYAYAD